jgi:adenine-specific DNA-methyltransferase
MASLLHPTSASVRLLEPAAGVGSLISAAVEALCTRPARPTAIHVRAFEVDPALIDDLQQAIRSCADFARAVGVLFSHEVILGDFLERTADTFGGEFFAGHEAPVDVVIMNPPYRKIRANSPEREYVRRIGLETSNLYTAFLAAATLWVRDGGELVAITPRSFCNGSYFRPFRSFLLDRAAFTHVHLFDSRTEAFKDDAVLQENIVFRMVRNGSKANVTLSTSHGSEDPLSSRSIPHEQLAPPRDKQAFIYLTPEETDRRVAESASALGGSLASLGLHISTGRVVDFRTKANLRAQLEPGAVPLLYPTHLRQERVFWPALGKKANAIAMNETTRDLLIRKDYYVLVKRFTAKEERRRVVAAVLHPDDVPGEFVGIENHLNYFHRNGQGLDAELARGLAAFLNSTLVDVLFRQFSGHTQVNATDLRSIPYPTEEELRRLARALGEQRGASASLVDPFIADKFLGPYPPRQSPPDPSSKTD